ncbi:ferritin-like domain-containing protein [Lenzites betulinus]|nr:ferritin-like domain-containing protein [Lenzites betulinus]
MFKTAILLPLVTAAAVLGAPAPSIPSSTSSLPFLLNFALTLEHLENAFYSQGLAKYTAQDFEQDGLPAWVYGRFVQILEHEATHVKFLTDALGDNAVKACEYDFPYDSPKAFAAMSMVFETVGASAYLGSAKFLANNADYLTAAGSILAVEARQASWVTASVMKLQPWNGAFEVPLTPSGAFSLASPFIKSCPSTNPPIPVTVFPALQLSTSSPAHGSTITATYKPAGATPPSGSAFVAWLDGLQVLYTPLGKGGETTVPANLTGTAYAAVVNAKEPPSDENMLTGFAVVQFPFDSRARTDV